MAVALLVSGRQARPLGGGQLLDAIEHAGPGFVLLANVTLGDAAVEHLVEVVRVGVHEDRLARATGRQVGDRGLGLHVLHGIHADAQMGQKRLGKDLAQLVVDRGSAGRHAIASAIAAERAKEGTVRGAGVHAVQTVDDVQAFLEGLQRLDGLGQLGCGQRAAVAHSRRDAGLRVEALILHEEDHAFRTTGTNRSRSADSWKDGGSQSGAGAGSHSLEQISTIQMHTVLRNPSRSQTNSKKQRRVREI